MSRQNHTLSRRAFIRQATCASLGITSLVNTLSYLQLTGAALAQASSINDYKALVCIFLEGGNDSNNMLFPGGTAADSIIRADYELGRASLAMNDYSNLLDMPDTTTIFDKYYSGAKPSLITHPSAPELAQLFNEGDLAFVCNVGTLAAPIPTREAYINQAVPLPRHLYSHSDQQMQWQTSVADSLSQTGWGGRVADLLHSAYNSDSSKVSISISLSGVNAFQRGLQGETVAFSLGKYGGISMEGYGSNESPYQNAYHDGSSFGEPKYQNSREGIRLKTIEELIRISRSNLLEDTYTGTIANARIVEERVGSAINLADSTGVNYEQIFGESGTDLIDQLKIVAKLIAGRSKLGNKRQIFFVRVGGYDVHKDHLLAHDSLMKELSTGMLAFRNALKANDDWDNVLTFTASDFNRTLTPNGTGDDAGSDHAWGGHAMVMGGPVLGGQLYGHFPSLKIGEQHGSIDAHVTRGRFIPSVAVDQYAAVIAKWFGVESNAMHEIFPNLYRFNSPFSTAEPNLHFLTQ